jgi:hypothetical protein
MSVPSASRRRFDYTKRVTADKAIARRLMPCSQQPTHHLGQKSLKAKAVIRASLEG